MTERREYDLSEVRADGWFERLAGEAPHFLQLCDAVGEKVVAFSIIVGARILSVHVDQRHADGSLIEFSVGDDGEPTRLVLAEFRQRLCATLASLEVSTEPPSADADADALQGFLGFRTVLLAALYGIRLEALLVGDGLPPSVRILLSGTEEEVPLQDLRAALRERVRAEAAGPGGGFSIELQAIDEAELASEKEDHEKVHELLSQWLGPLSALLRSPEGYSLAPDVRDRLAYALALLGTAYDARGEEEQAADCFRLGVQWAQAQNSYVLADLFVRFGASLIHQGKEGQAIGMLRRSLHLGADEGRVMVLLAGCYATIGEWLAAIVCVETAESHGCNDEALAEVRKGAEGILGDAWMRFRERVPPPAQEAATRPPPGIE